MTLPEWVGTDLTKAFFAAERHLSPRLEAVLRTDAALDTLAATHAVRRILGRAVYDTTNGAVEALGLPSSRQVRRLQQSIDHAERNGQ